MTPSGTPSATSSPAAGSASFKTRGRLVINLVAADYNNATGAWDNRATTGAFNADTNGDFQSVIFTAGRASKKITLGGATGVNMEGTFFRSVNSIAWYTGSSIWGNSDWTVEAWVNDDGRETAEKSIIQWGMRGTTAADAALGIGSNPTYSAGGFFGGGYDVAYLTDANTQIGPGGGPRPIAGTWHHIAMTYTGIVPADSVLYGVASHTVTLYLDGAVNNQYYARTLAVTRPTLDTCSSGATAYTNCQNIVLGAMMNNGAAQIVYNGMTIGQLRLHDGLLQADEIKFNYELDAAYYRPSLTSATSSPAASPMLGASPSPAACPAAFPSTTHYLKAFSLQQGDLAGAYARHYAYWIISTPAFPVTDAVASGDATFLRRLAVDGTPGAVTLQSINYLDRVATPNNADGYLYHDTFGTTVGDTPTSGNLGRGSWFMDPQPNGNIILRSLTTTTAGYTNKTVALQPTASSSHLFISSPNLRVIAGTPGQEWTVTDPLASLSAYSPWRSERVLIEALAAPGHYIQSCGGSVTTVSTRGTANVAAPMTIVPAIGCATTCATNTFSLKPSLQTYLFMTASGALEVGTTSDADFTFAGATFIGSRVSIRGATGWTLSAALGHATGAVLTRSPESCTVAGTCCSVNGAAGLLFAPVPASGLTSAHLFRLFWEDGAGDLTTLPASGYAGAPACASTTGSPVATTTASSSGTLSSAPTPSLTPTTSSKATGVPTTTPTSTASPVGSLSSSSSASLTSSSTPSNAQTPSRTASTTISSTPSLTSSITATRSSPVNVAGRLWIDLDAADYDPVAALWDNRASMGAVSGGNGDFVGSGSAASNPLKVLLGSRASPAVLFNASADGVADRLMSAHAAFPSANSFYGASDWSLEAWVWLDGWTQAGENALFQWGTRPGTTCNVANMGVGSHPVYGAGGHWGCDMAFGGPAASMQLAASSGFQPTPGAWHLLTWTYSGATGDVPYLESLYVDGAPSAAYADRVLAIAKVSPLYLGAFVNAAGSVDVGGVVALARLRFHDGCLTTADVARNYAVEAPLMMASASVSSTVSSSTSGMLSAVMTPAVTPSAAIPTATQSATATPTRVSSPSSSAVATESGTAATTLTVTSSAAATPTPALSASGTPTVTVSPRTETPTSTRMSTLSSSSAATPSSVSTVTPTSASTATATPSSMSTATPSSSSAATLFSRTATATRSKARAVTSLSAAPSRSRAQTRSATATRTRAASRSMSKKRKAAL